MSDIFVRIVGTANLTQQEAAFGKLNAELAMTNTHLKEMIALQNGVDAKGYERMTRAAEYNSKVFRNAAASTGMFEVQQVRVNDATDDYVKKLKAQKLSFREMARQRDVATKALQRQLALDRMMIREGPASISHGKRTYDVITPKRVASEIHTAGVEMAWMNEQIKSGAHQMVNWGKNMQWAGRQLTVGLTMPVLAFGAAAGVMAYQVDKELTRVQKVYDATAQQGIALEKEMAAVREAGLATATKAAEEYGSAAQDTLQVQAELAATGLKGQQLQESTAEVMRIARLGEIEHQDAIQSTIALQSVFRMSNEELTKSFNYMNAVENATSLQTKDFAQAIPIAAAPIKQFGGDIYELGILLTAMKERGIEATQGANAIKSAMQRLGRPSKQIQEEFTAITGADITKIFEQSNSLTEIFQKIGQVTKDLSKQDKTKVFAGLFGSYQVTRMSALVEGMQDLENGVGQVSRAYQLSEDAPTKWADIAEQEMKAYQESISGQFDITLNTLKMQFQKFGEPFIQVATGIMKAVIFAMKVFDELPKGLKIAAAIGLGLAAISGPIIMLIGLFANLAGNTLKFGAMIVGLGAKMEILDTETKTAQMAAMLLGQEFREGASDAQLMTNALHAQTAALEESNMAMRQRYATAAATLPASVGSPGGTPTGTSTWVVDPDAAKKVEKTSDKLTKNGKEQLATEKKRTGALAASAGWMAVGAVSMIGMTAASSEGARKMWEYVMYASMLAPALIMAVSAAGALVTRIKAAVLLTNAQEASTKRATAATLMLSWAWNGVKRAIAFAAAGLKFMFLNPIGLAILAVTGLALLFYKLWKDHREAQKEAWRQQDALTHATENWAEAAGQARKEYERIAVVGLPEGPKMGEDLLSDVKYYKDEKSGQETIRGLENRDSAEQDRIAMKMLIDLQTQYGLSAKRAQTNVQAMFVAMGYGADQAKYRVEGLAKEIGGLESTNWDEIVQNAAQVMADATDPGRLAQMSEEGRESTINNQVNKFVETWSAAFSRAKTPVQANNVFNELEKVTMSRWDQLLERMRAGSQKVRDFLAKEGIGSGKELSQWWRKQGKELEGSGMPTFATVGGYDPIALFQSAAVAADEYEAKVIDAIRELNLLNKGISTTAELQYNYNILAQMLSYDQAVKSVKQLAREMLALKADAALGMDVSKGFFNLNKRQQEMQRFKSMSEEERNQFQATMEAFASANNIKIGKNALQTYHNILNNVKNTTDDVTGSTKKWANAVQFAKDEIASVRQSAMQGVQEDIADEIRTAFDDRMESSLEARQNMWDRRADALSANIEKRQEGLENEFERRERALDAKWETKTDKAEAYWDRRADAVDRAIEVEQRAEEKRQKMFDAEIARINKLNEAMNRNIDFNMALSTGKFDEAAKIRNDAEAASAQTALERAASAGSAASDRRVNRLEGRREAIDKAREQYMKDLQKREEAERRHLERLKEMRTKALERQSERQQKHLERMTEADMEAQNEIWENRKESLEDQLELFTSFIARNEKELKDHMDNVGLSYKNFGEKVLKPKGENWAKFFGDRMKHHIRTAGNELKTDKVWEQLGKQSVERMLKGMGFNSIKDFKHFVNTGEWKNTGGGGGGSGTGRGKTGKPPPDPPGGATHHEGGLVGSAKSSRKGIARTLSGLHNSEQMVRAQKGEYIVNKKSTEKNRAILEKINYHGSLDKDDGVMGGVGTGPGMAVAGALSAAFMQGVGRAMEDANAAAEARRAAAAASGMFSAGAAGMYSDRAFSKAQLKNAAIIASVGSSMGMSKRDIMIGIMTAITESGLVNVNHGHLDSLGLFQQRASWGSAENRTDPEWAARRFFNALKAVGNRGDLSPWMAAQTVQRSAYSDGSNYRQYWDNAQAIYNKGLTEVATGSGAWGNYSLPGVKPWVLEAANYLGGKYNIKTIGGVGSRPGPSEHPLGRALDFMVSDERGTALANEVVKRHRALDAMYVIWRQRINSFNGQGWRGMEDRGSPTANHMDHVHVSFDATGDTGDLPRPSSGGGATAAGGVRQGPGGRHRPVGGSAGRLHDTGTDFPAVDIGGRVGTPIKAAADGRVSSSYDIRGYEPRIQRQNGYRSYGRVITINHGDFATLYAHLSKRYAQDGQRVRGGTVIGAMGSTGYSFGSHLHFGARGISPYAFLKDGTPEVRFDNTIANLHKGEAVLTKNMTEKFHQGVDRFAEGPSVVYDVDVRVEGTNASIDEITKAVTTALQKAEAKRPGARRRNG